VTLGWVACTLHWCVAATPSDSSPFRKPRLRFNAACRHLRYHCAWRHPRYVRHATPEDLDCLEELLQELRELRQLRERKRGYFSRGSRAFLHFHEDAGDFYVDVRLSDVFERMRVTTRNEQTTFLALVRRGVQSHPSARQPSG